MIIYRKSSKSCAIGQLLLSLHHEKENIDIRLFNGFQKKSQKTPPNEIEKALKIKESYYADKQSSNR